MSAVASPASAVARFVRAVAPPKPWSYELQVPEQIQVDWTCFRTSCPGTLEVAVVLEREIYTGHPVACWVRCPACGTQTVYQLSTHAVERWRQRIGPSTHALHELVEGQSVQTPKYNARYSREYGAVFTLDVQEGDPDRVVATTAYLESSIEHENPDDTHHG